MNGDGNPPEEAAPSPGGPGKPAHASSELVRVARERERIAAEREHIAEERGPSARTALSNRPAKTPASHAGAARRKPTSVGAVPNQIAACESSLRSFQDCCVA